MGTFRRQRIDEQDGLEAPRFNYTSDVFEPLAAGEQYRTALAAVDRHGIIDRRTFPEVAADANRWAALLRAQGLSAGDRIILRLPPGSAWCGVVLGALKAGIVVVSCSASLPLADVARRASETQARLLVSEELPDENEVEWLPVIRAADAMAQLGRLTGVQPTHGTTVDDLALIVYTAGTTSVPVGAAHTHGNVEAAQEHGAEWLGTGPGDVVWCSADTGRATALWDLLGAWSTGATVILHADAEALELEEQLDLIDKLGVTVISDTPELYAAIVEMATVQPVALPRLRRALSTGGELPRELIESFRALFGVTIHNGFLQAESLVLTANLDDDVAKAGSIGKPLYGAELAVITDDGAESGPGVEGDLAVIGDPPSLFTGYWNNPDAMEASVRGYWFLTGDRAVIDEDGTFWLAGRVGVSRDERKDQVAAEAVAEVEAVEAARVRAIAEAEEEERHWAETQARAAAEERERREAEARAVAEAEERERLAALELAQAETAARAREEEDARKEAEERARAQAEEEARREAEEREWEEAQAQAEADERARREAEARAAAEAEEQERAASLEQARAEAEARAAEEERVRRETEERIRAQAEEEARLETEARARAEAEERERAAAVEEARVEAEARAAEDERVRREAEERVRAQAEEEARLDAEERARAEEQARQEAEMEAQEEVEAKKRAREEAAALAAAEAKAARAGAEAKRHAEAEARAQARADERARKQAEAGAKAQAAAEAKARKKAEEDAKTRERAEGQARQKAEAEAKAQAEIDAKERAKAEAQARKEAEVRAREDEKARKEAEARAQKEAEAKARADEKERKEAEARAQKEAEAKARADEKERKEAEMRARKEAEAKAREEEKARKEAEAQARRRDKNGAEPAPAPEEVEEEPGVPLYERLRAYGRSGDEDPPAK